MKENLLGIDDTPNNLQLGRQKTMSTKLNELEKIEDAVSNDKRSHQNKKFQLKQIMVDFLEETT